MAVTYKAAQIRGEYVVQFKCDNRELFLIVDRACNRAIERDEDERLGIDNKRDRYSLKEEFE